MSAGNDGSHESADLLRAVVAAVIGIALFYRNRFPCQEGFVQHQGLILQNTAIGWHAVSGFEQNQIPNRNLSGRNVLRFAVPNHRCRRRCQLTELFQGTLGAVFLKKAQQCIEKNDGNNGQGLHPFAHHQGNGGRTQQNQGHQVLEL